MSKKQVVVECPCCESRLVIDVLTESVVSAKGKTELDATGKPVLRDSDWDSAAKKVRERGGEAADKFDASLNRERSREQDLDQLFEGLRKKKEADEE